MVHRERGRVDAILTGIGTVRTDDPLLTARDGRIRRVARRVVVDPRLTIAPGAQLVLTAGTIPTTIVCNEQVSRRTVHAHQFLREQGVELFGLEPVRGDELPLRELLRQLVRRHAVSTVLVEGGPTLLGHLFRERLVNEAWVYVAPQVGGEAPLVGIDAERLSLISVHRRGGDVFARYWVDG
jgi:diaminohydroxyphosphoribosylaminopyrimidine deaminase/5-amino-6-(5-phosphoribosylamino)uracil reductase